MSAIKRYWLAIAVCLVLIWAIGAGPWLLNLVSNGVVMALVVAAAIFLVWRGHHAKRIAFYAIGALLIVGLLAPFALSLLVSVGTALHP